MNEPLLFIVQLYAHTKKDFICCG